MYTFNWKLNHLCGGVYMKKMVKVGMIMISILMIVVGCSVSESNSSVDSSKLEEYEVKNIEDEVTEGDYVFRLVSEKEVYEVGEEIQLYGELTYIGDQDEVIIEHASNVFIFPMVEHVREHDISGGTNDEAIQTTLVPNEPYRENYAKNGVGYAEEDPQAYKKFIKDFMERDDFPAGYYEVQGEAYFYDGEEHVEMEATVDFKVVE